MKSNYIVLCIIVICNSTSYCQQIIPNSTFFKNNKAIKDIENEKRDLIDLSENLNPLKTKSQEVIAFEKDSLEKEIDKKDSILIELKDDQAIVIFSASSSLNSSEELKNYSGSSKVSALLRIAPILSIAMSYNLAAVKPQSISRDSIDLIALMFPESGSTGYTISSQIKLNPENKNRKKEVIHSLFAGAEFSFKQTKFQNIEIDSSGIEIEDGTREFSALNYNIGLRYEYCYTPDKNPKDPVVFNAMIYYNYFNIPNEDQKNFELVIKEKFAKNSSISSVGAKFTLQYKGFVLFGDFRQNLSTSNFSDDNKFKGFVYNIGTLINTNLLRL